MLGQKCTLSNKSSNIRQREYYKNTVKVRQVKSVHCQTDHLISDRGSPIQCVFGKCEQLLCTKEQSLIINLTHMLN